MYKLRYKQFIYMQVLHASQYKFLQVWNTNQGSRDYVMAFKEIKIMSIIKACDTSSKKKPRLKEAFTLHIIQ